MDENTKEEIDYKYGRKLELMEKEHFFNMERLRYIRETEHNKHEWELERQRIRTAEVRKNYAKKMEILKAGKDQEVPKN